MKEKIKNFLLELFFPKFCLNCQKEGNLLCQDCQSMLDVSGFHKNFQTKGLKDLYFAGEYENPVLKNLTQKFKYEPFVKELAKPLSSLIIEHLELIENKPDFSEGLLVPVPLGKRRLRWRGFNPAEEIAKELSKFFKLPFLSDVLIKTKETLPQVELSDEERKENVKGVFRVEKKELIKNKKILLIDDIYTTGATMEECARVLKESGAKEIIGIVIARAKPGKDQFPKI